MCVCQCVCVCLCVCGSVCRCVHHGGLDIGRESEIAPSFVSRRIRGTSCHPTGLVESILHIYLFTAHSILQNSFFPFYKFSGF